MLRKTEKSSCFVPGPNTVLRPTLPNVNCGGAVKQEVSNQRSTVGLSSFGSQPATALGRWNPDPFSVLAAIVGVNGVAPVSRRTTFSWPPPRGAVAQPLTFFANSE